MSEWIEWGGGNCPLPEHTLVKVQLRSEGRSEADYDKEMPAAEYDWKHGLGSSDIIAYRIIGVANNNAPAPDRAEAINDLVAYFHGKSAAAGWWKDGKDKYVLATKLMLAVSELAEAMEGLRKDLMDDKLPHRKMAEVELGDALIRICDLAGALGYDLGGATMEKDAYNANRADHKPEARAAAGGKGF